MPLYKDTLILDKKKIVWSYCLYGRNIDLYYKPLLINLDIARKLNVKVVLFTTLSECNFVKDYFQEFIDILKVVSINKRFIKLHRYLAPDYIQGDYYFYKDTDSVITMRELTYSINWCKEINSSAMLVRDHPLHISPIMGGMFALNSDLAKILSHKVIMSLDNPKKLSRNTYLYDQLWLTHYIYPLIAKKAHVYSSFFYYKNEHVVDISHDRDAKDFIGAQYKENAQRSLVLESYSKYYRTSKGLTLPFIRKFSFLYQKVRLVLFFARVYEKITN
ncbi:hypothetical protein GNP73_00235 [Aliivibrio fischeri]|uniref:hypothetical protein n=1 Tax=Aliivibrio fischeri TaxID=668 RepID=UPI0012DAE0D5|nr:hypothetical protein [Aliivibrio fischeri]MUJ26412.1 hypothetical protein [Aliivibrio fischeri]